MKKVSDSQISKLDQNRVSKTYILKKELQPHGIIRK